MTEQDKKILTEIRELLYPSMEVQAVYLSESKSLRRMAEQAEKREKLLNDFDNLLYKIGAIKEVTTTTTFNIDISDGVMYAGNLSTTVGKI